MGHIAVGMAAARAFLPRDATKGQLRRAMAAFCALSMLPDADVIAFTFGIPYEHPFGHRGFTHSFAFALLMGGVTYAIAKWRGWPALRAAAFVAVVIASHAVLDTLTDGGLGCALLWPFSSERYFAPVTPIPVAPIGRYMFSGRGVFVLAFETLLFLPVFIYATFPRRRGASGA